MSTIYYRTHNTFLDFALSSQEDGATAQTNDCTPFSDNISISTGGTRLSAQILRRSSSDPVFATAADEWATDSEDTRILVDRRCRSDSSWSTVVPFTPLPRKESNHKIFVGGLSPITDDLVLFEFMSQFGPVKNVTVKRNPITGQSRRYAFVKFYQPPDPSVFKHSWSVDDNIIRISKYQVSSTWKNHYYSDDEL